MLITRKNIFWFLIKVLTRTIWLKTDCRKKCLSLHHNRASSYFFVNGTESVKLKAKHSEINLIPLGLGSFSDNVSVDNMEETWFYEYFYDFSIDYDTTAVDDILDIHKYLMENNNIWAIR